MSGLQRKIDEYVSLKPSRFSLLTRFEWSLVPLDEGYAQHLAIHLRREGPGVDELILTFKEVRNVQFLCPGTATVLLEMRDVSGQQWDRVTFEGKDTENGAISFLCQDFSFIVREIAG